jgi:SAM-dependent methyltransferase
MKSGGEKLSNSTMTQNSCLICKGTSIQELYRCNDHFVSGELFSVVTCQECGFTFTEDPPSESVIGLYYKSDSYISHSDSKKGLVNKLYHLARSYMLRRKWKTIESQTGLSTGKLLDIGCGTGYFLNYMQQKGWDVSGIEKDSGAREYASTIMKVDVSDQEKLNGLGESIYDCITLWHVLEHFHNPDTILETIHRSLTNSGIAVIAVPNMSSFDAKHYGPHWAAWDVPRHLWHFTPETISLLLKRHNMEIVSTRRLPFDSFYVSLLSEQYKRGKPALIKGLFWGKLSWLNAIFKKNQTSSLVYIIKKIDD